MTRPNSDQCMAHNKENCEPYQLNMEEKHFFVQKYVVLGEDVVAKGAVNKKLNCIRLKWERHGEDEEEREKGEVYELCPLLYTAWVYRCMRYNETSFSAAA